MNKLRLYGTVILAIIMLASLAGYAFASEGFTNWLSTVRFASSTQALPNPALIAEAEAEQKQVRTVVDQTVTACLEKYQANSECFEAAVTSALIDQSFSYAGDLVAVTGTFTPFSAGQTAGYQIVYEVLFTNVAWSGEFGVDKSGAPSNGGFKPRWREISIADANAQLRYSLPFLEDLPAPYRLQHLYIEIPGTWPKASNAPADMDWPLPENFVADIVDDSGSQFFLYSMGFDMRLQNAEDGEIPQEFMVALPGAATTVKGRAAVWQEGTSTLPFDLADQLEVPLGRTVTTLNWAIPYSGKQGFKTTLHNMVVSVESTKGLESLLLLAEALP